MPPRRNTRTPTRKQAPKPRAPRRAATSRAPEPGRVKRREDAPPAAARPPKLSLVAPCFNEAEGIEAVVREWNQVLDGLPFTSEIVLCDDGSTDRTGELLAALAAGIPRLRVVSFPQNAGYGRALSAAIAASHGDFVATLDSDGQFDARDAVLLLQVLEAGGFDCVTGFRTRKADSALRVAADRGLNQLVRRLFSIRLRDTNCALKVGRGEVLRALRIEARGYPTPTEMVLRLAAAGRRIGEAPVTHRERLAGASKLHPFRTAWSMLRFLLYLRARLSLFRARIILEP